MGENGQETSLNPSQKGFFQSWCLLTIKTRVFWSPSARPALVPPHPGEETREPRSGSLSAATLRTGAADELIFSVGVQEQAAGGRDI